MTRPGQPPGPFETEQQARELPAVREVYRQFGLDPGVGKMTPHNQRMLLDALAAGGVYLGTYDHRIVLWLAGWEPQVVAVICGWIERASQARMRDGPPVPSPPGDRRQEPQTTSPRSQAPAEAIVGRGGDGGPAPCRPGRR